MSSCSVCTSCGCTLVVRLTVSRFLVQGELFASLVPPSPDPEMPVLKAFSQSEPVSFQVKAVLLKVGIYFRISSYTFFGNS